MLLNEEFLRSIVVVKCRDGIRSMLSCRLPLPRDISLPHAHVLVLVSVPASGFVIRGRRRRRRQAKCTNHNDNVRILFIDICIQLDLYFSENIGIRLPSLQ